MDINEWPVDLRTCKLKTARQKKRLMKEDLDRQLRHLYKRYSILRQQKRNLPMMPVKEPYQKGWKRTFVLRADVKASNKAPMYQQLLDKINTVQYCRDKSFKKRAAKHHKGKRVYEEMQQDVRRFYTGEWTLEKQELTDAEKLHFHLEDVMNERYGERITMYVFNEPWRFVLQIRPNIIYETRVLDCELEQEIGELKLKIDRNNLQPKIQRLKGRKQTWKTCRGEKEKYKFPCKNKALHTIMDECTDY